MFYDFFSSFFQKSSIQAISKRVKLVRYQLVVKSSKDYFGSFIFLFEKHGMAFDLFLFEFGIIYKFVQM